MQRTRVSATDWKTERLEVHMSGRAVLFKTIARETVELRSGFTAVPAGIDLAQGVWLLDHAPADGALASATSLIVNRQSVSR